MRIIVFLTWISIFMSYTNRVTLANSVSAISLENSVSAISLEYSVSVTEYKQIYIFAIRVSEPV